MNKYTLFGYDGGTFSKEELDFARRNNIPLTLDLAIPCGCLNNCIFCGYRDTQKGEGLTLKEILNIVDQFKDLGGKSIKILGEGEPKLALKVELPCSKGAMAKIKKVGGTVSNPVVEKVAKVAVKQEKEENKVKSSK